MERQPPPRAGGDVGGKETGGREQPQADEEQRGAPSALHPTGGAPTAEPSEAGTLKASTQGFLGRRPPHISEDEWKKLDRAGQDAVIDEWKQKELAGHAARDEEYWRWHRARGHLTQEASEKASAANATPLGPARSAGGGGK